jgi:hypothetical protein
MNRRTTLALAAGLLAALAPASAGAQPSAFFVHRASAANTQFNQTFIDNPIVNNNPNAIVFATPNLNPPLAPGMLSPNPIAVSFNAWNGRWAVVDQKPAAITIGSSYNIRVSQKEGPTVLGRLHRGTGANTVGNFTDIDDPALNNNPNAIVIVTHNWVRPGDASARLHNHAVGVWYNFNTGKWSIFNEDIAPMPVGMAFNYIAGFGAFVHRAIPPNLQGVSTFVDNLRTNGRPDALILVTHNWNPGGSFYGIYNDSPIGVRYAAPHWAIFNERLTPNIAVGAAFNVLPLNY